MEISYILQSIIIKLLNLCRKQNIKFIAFIIKGTLRLEYRISGRHQFDKDFALILN